MVAAVAVGLAGPALGGAVLLTVPDGALPAVGDRSSVQPATSANSPVVTTRAIDRLMRTSIPAPPQTPCPLSRLRGGYIHRGVGKGDRGW